MKLKNIAKLLNYNIYGNSDLFVNTICYASDAKETDMAIAFSKKDLKTTKAQVVLTTPTLLNPHDKTLLFCTDEPENALVKIIRLFQENGYYPNYSTPPKSISNDTCKISNTSVIMQGAIIEPNVLIGENCFIDSNAHIRQGSIIKDNVHIGAGTVIGADSFYNYYDNGLKIFEGVGQTIIESNVWIGNHSNIQRGTISPTIIGHSSTLGNFIDIGHDVKIGSNCKIVSHVGIAGNAIIGNYVQIYGHTAIANFVQINDNAIILAKSGVSKNVPANKTYSGLYAREHSENLRLHSQLLLNRRR